MNSGKCFRVSEMVPSTEYAKFLIFFYFFFYMQWCNIQWNDSDNILIPDQGQAADRREAAENQVLGVHDAMIRV